MTMMQRAARRQAAKMVAVHWLEDVLESVLAELRRGEPRLFVHEREYVPVGVMRAWQDPVFRREVLRTFAGLLAHGNQYTNLAIDDTEILIDWDEDTQSFWRVSVLLLRLRGAE